MKSGVINLLSFFEAEKKKEIFELYRRINCIENLSDEEINGIKTIYRKFIEYLDVNDSKLSGYFLGKQYKRVVSEEFDILRFSDKKIINIELKSERISDEEIKRQLNRHDYFLKSIDIDLEVKLFTYIQETDELFKYCDNKKDIVPCKFNELIDEIPTDFVEKNLLERLNPTSFIISPYSDIKRFSSSQYFFNIQQKEAENLLKKSDKRLLGLRGGAGTGKSLILFDVAEYFSSNLEYKVLFIFCSKMEVDEIMNIDKVVSFKFTDIVNVVNIDLETFDIIIIDESQRLTKSQWDNYISLLDQGKIDKLILSVDNAQTLRPEEKELNIEDKLKKISENDKDKIEYVDYLTNSVRSDIELETFIKKLFDKKKSIKEIDFPKVNAVYFENENNARDFIEYCRNKENFVPIELPECKKFKNGYVYSTELEKIYNSSNSAFNVVGREFDRVVLPLRQEISYDSEGKLIIDTKKNYRYLAENCLFQAITRVKSELLLVVIGNEKLYRKIYEILTWKNYKKLQKVAQKIKLLREVHGIEMSTILDKLKIAENKYLDIEAYGTNNKKYIKKISELYGIEKKYIEEDQSEYTYSKLELVYKKKINSLESKVLEGKLEQDIINFIQNWDKQRLK